jgi:hypothetical protein
MAEQALQKGFKGSFDKTEIDDNFFSLREMEKFCDEEDEKEMNGEELELDEELVDQLYGEGDDEEDEEDDKEDDLIPKGFYQIRYNLNYLIVYDYCRICL